MRVGAPRPYATETDAEPLAYVCSGVCSGAHNCPYRRCGQTRKDTTSYLVRRNTCNDRRNGRGYCLPSRFPTAESCLLRTSLHTAPHHHAQGDTSCSKTCCSGQANSKGAAPRLLQITSTATYADRFTTARKYE